MGNSIVEGGVLQHSNLFTNEVPDCGNKRMEKKCIEIGLLDEKGYEQNNRVYSRGGCSQTVVTANARIKTIRKYEKDKSSRSNRKYRTTEQG